MVERTASDAKPGFWSTIPGYLTAIGSFLAAVTGLLVFLNHIGLIGSPAPPPSPPMTQAPPPPVTQEPAAKTLDPMRKGQGKKDENQAAANKTSVLDTPGAERRPADEVKGASKPSEAEKRLAETEKRLAEAEKRLADMQEAEKVRGQRLVDDLNQHFAPSQNFSAFKVSLVRVEAGPGPQITVYLSYTNKTGADLQLGLCYPKSRNTTRVTDNAAYDYTFVSGNGVGDVCTGASFPLIVPAGTTTHASLVFEPTTVVRQKPDTFSLVSQHVIVERTQGGFQVQSTHTVSLKGQAPR